MILLCAFFNIIICLGDNLWMGPGEIDYKKKKFRVPSPGKLNFKRPSPGKVSLRGFPRGLRQENKSEGIPTEENKFIFDFSSMLQIMING